jgi:hypothetical protein
VDDVALPTLLSWAWMATTIGCDNVLEAAMAAHEERARFPRPAVP